MTKFDIQFQVIDLSVHTCIIFLGIFVIDFLG